MDSTILQEIIRSAVVLAAVVVVWFMLTRAVAHYVKRIGQGESVADQERSQRANTLWVGTRRLLFVIVLIVVALTLMGIWSIPITPFVAVGSAAAVAVGLGAQSVVKDMISGFLILAENQFAIGDVVNVAGVAGAVQEMRLRVTVLRDLNGYVHYIPNGLIGVASNYTSAFATVVVDVGISYSSDIDKALEIMRDELGAIASEHSADVLEEPTVLGVQELGNSSVSLRATMNVAPTARWTIKREALRRIKLRFDREGIEIPFPQMTVHLPHGSDPTPDE